MVVPLFATKLKNEIVDELAGSLLATDGGYFSTVAAGLLAVAEGETFWSDESGPPTAYRKDAGVAVSIAGFATTAALAAPGGGGLITLGHTTLTSLKAAPITSLTYNLVGTAIDGSFSYQTADAPYVADDVNVIKQDDTALSVGAFVRNTVYYASRTASVAKIAAAKDDGSIVNIAGQSYRVDSTATGNASATNDLSINGLVPHGVATVMHYGGLNDGIVDCRNALVYATLNNGHVHFPAGDYKIGSTIDYGALNVSLSLQNPNIVLSGDGHELSNISYTGTGTMLIGGAASASGSYAQSLSIRGLQIHGTGAVGASTALTIGKFTTTSNGFAGCDSTQQLAYWEFTAPSVIEDCDIRFFKTGIQTKFGYSFTIRNNRFRNVNNALNIGGAATTGLISGNLIELCGIGIALTICTGITISDNAIQANYGGVDIYSYNWNSLIRIWNNYFEVSTKNFVQDGDSAGEFTSNNFDFYGNKTLEIDLKLVAQNFTFRNNRIKSFTSAGTNIERIIVGDNYDDDDDGLSLFTNYAGAGAAKIIVENSPIFYSQTYDPGSMLVNGVDSATVSVAGTKVGDRVDATFSNNSGGVQLYGTVTAAGSVQFYFWNPPWGSTVDLASGTLKIWVYP